MLNHIVIMGRLTRDPELRYTKSNKAVASFTIACDRDFGDKETDFVDVSAWQNTAEFVNTYVHKGSLVAVSGRLQSRKWQDRDGNNRVNWEIVADNVYFAESKKRGAVDVMVTERDTAIIREDESDAGDLPF